MNHIIEIIITIYISLKMSMQNAIDFHNYMDPYERNSEAKSTNKKPTLTAIQRTFIYACSFGDEKTIMEILNSSFRNHLCIRTGYNVANNRTRKLIDEHTKNNKQ